MQYGFIGSGNMGGAIAKAVCKSVGAEYIWLADTDQEKAQRLADELNCKTCSNQEAAQADFVFLGVKPQFMAEMLAGIAPVLKKREDVFTLVTMAGGLSIERILQMAGGKYPIIRIMPNTPVAVESGMITYCAQDVAAETIDVFLQAMKYAGRIDILPERLIDAASCVSGCGPAWTYQFIEALADGGVACGLPRVKAMEYAAQMCIGSARMVLESGKHPGTLKDEVCSPGGSTIQGVRILEERAFRGAVMDAVIKAYEKTLDMGKA